MARMDKYYMNIFVYCMLIDCLQCIVIVGLASERAPGLQKNLRDEVMAWLSVWNELQMICITSS